MMHIRAVVNQVGVAMELHDHPERKEPVTILLVGWGEMDAYRASLEKSNPDYRHAVIGQLAVMYANRIFKDVTVTQCAWTFNASTGEYSRA